VRGVLNQEPVQQQPFLQKPPRGGGHAELAHQLTNTQSRQAAQDREMKRVKNGRYYLIPASPDTAGHGTTANARWYKAQLAEVLNGAGGR
jgi:hypothetical protein